MPHKTFKEAIIDALIDKAAEEIILNEGKNPPEIETDDAVDGILDELAENVYAVMECRRGFYSAIPKSVDWCNNILTTFDENRFRQMLRVNREQFSELIDLIKDDEVFNKAHSCKQFPLELQLAITLFRLGSSGESAAYRKIATIFGVGDGETISIITKRVFQAFLRLRSKYIFWPDETERSEIVSQTFNELPFCIGYIDGTEVKLAEAPVEDHTAYYSRNHIYSIKVQVVCDFKRIVRHLVVGYPGSWHDARMYRNSSLYKNKERYFSGQQWIAGDSAYPLSATLITPYRSNARQLNRNAQIAFNIRHSKYRVRVEHCFGVLKERFGSLKQLRMRLANEKSHKLCCDWIYVCCIIHNILASSVSSLSDFEIDSPNSEDNSTEPEELSTNNAGEIKRQAIYSLMFS